MAYYPCVKWKGNPLKAINGYKSLESAARHLAFHMRHNGIARTYAQIFFILDSTTGLQISLNDARKAIREKRKPVAMDFQIPEFLYMTRH